MQKNFIHLFGFLLFLTNATLLSILDSLSRENREQCNILTFLGMISAYVYLLVRSVWVNKKMQMHNDVFLKINSSIIDKEDISYFFNFLKHL